MYNILKPLFLIKSKNQKIIIICILFSMNNLFESYSQNISGLVTYSIHMKKKDYKNKSQKVKKIIDGVNNQAENLNLLLSFNNEKSFFTCIEPMHLNKKEKILFNIAKAKYKVYLNYYFSLREREYIEEIDLGGDIFLIKRKTNIKDWKLTNEFKKIGNYICYKAVRNITFTNWKKEVKVKEQVVWFTQSIPIAYGPMGFVGFPGLVIKVNDGELIYEVKRIELDTKGKNIIKSPPVKGIILSQESYEEMTRNSSAILNKKMKKRSRFK